MLTFWVFLACHIALVALMIWALVQAWPLRSIPAAILLLLYPIGYVFSRDIASLSAQLAFVFTGPLFMPLVILDAACRAPLIGLPALVAGGVAVWLVKHALAFRVRLGALVASAAACLTTLLVAETSVEVIMRIAAARDIGDYSSFQRLPVYYMVVSNNTEPGLGRISFASAYDARGVWHWSFKRWRFEFDHACIPKTYCS